jgi:hypothetical protein
MRETGQQPYGSVKVQMGVADIPNVGPDMADIVETSSPDLGTHR